MGRTITVSELSKTSDEVVLLDVRRKEDFDGLVIPIAQWHDPEQVDEWASELPSPRQRRCLVLCAGRLCQQQGHGQPPGKEDQGQIYRGRHRGMEKKRMEAHLSCGGRLRN